MDHPKWLTDTTGGDSPRAIGGRSGVPWRTIADQITRGRISAENVIAIAIAYGHHPVTALVDCGYLPAEYATAGDPVLALREVSEDALAEEVLRRMRLVGDHDTLTTPIGDLPQIRATRNVDADDAPPAEGGAELPTAARAGQSAGRQLRDAQDDAAYVPDPPGHDE